jgi:hypothetical protein
VKKSMEALMESLHAADKARALTIARQLAYLAAHSDGPIAERHEDLVWLLAYIEQR